MASFKNLLVHNIALAFIFFTLPAAMCQIPNFSWVKTAPSPNGGYSWAYKTATDKQGNTIVVGEFTFKAVFGKDTLNAIINPQNPGHQDLFVIKYDSNGNSLWATRIGSLAHDECNELVVDSSGDIYVSGWYTNTLYIGSTTLTQPAAGKYFVSKFSANGTLKWATGISGNLPIVSAVPNGGIAVDNGGNVYVTGHCKGNSVIGTLLMQTNTSMRYIYILKLNSNGVPLWYRNVVPLVADLTSGMVNIDNRGNIVISATMVQDVLIGSVPLAAGNQKPYYIKYDTNGNLLSYKPGPGLNFIIDTAGNYYSTGQIQRTLFLGTTGIASSLPSLYAIFIAKLDSSLAVKWVSTARGGVYNVGRGLAVDKNLNVYATGQYQDSIYFDSIKVPPSPFGPMDQYTIFVAKFNSQGRAIWVQQAGSTEYNVGNDIAVDNNENAYTVGSLSGYGSGSGYPVIFGNILISAPVVRTSMFLAKTGSVQLPYINNFAPGIAPAGDTITITGSGFSLVTGVSLSGINVPYTIISDSILVFTVPANAVSGYITLYTQAGKVVSYHKLAICTHTFISQAIQLCAGQVFQFGGTTISAAGTYTRTVPKIGSCDSIFNIQVTMLQPSTGTVAASICQGQTYTFGTQVLTNAGNYNRVITNAAGCDSIITLALAVIPKPATPVIIAMHDTLVVLPGYDTYSWLQLLPNGQHVLLNVTGNRYPAPTAACYRVVAAVNDCPSDTSALVCYTLTGSVKTSSKRVTIYPNPFQHSFSVAYENVALNSILKIADVTGKAVYTQTIHNPKGKIDIPATQFPRGMYLMSITGGNDFYATRLIKE